MQSPQEKEKRAERARQNGAKSTGPATPAGMNKARTASVQHGLYATPDTLSHMVDPAAYEDFRRSIQALWNPANPHITTRVNHLVSLLWEMNRLIATRREYMGEMFALNGPSVADIEVLCSRKGDILERIDLRIHKLNMEISRIERDLLRLQKHFASEGPSQKLLKTQQAAQTSLAAGPTEEPEKQDYPGKAPEMPPSAPHFTNEVPQETAPRS